EYARESFLRRELRDFNSFRQAAAEAVHRTVREEDLVVSWKRGQLVISRNLRRGGILAMGTKLLRTVSVPRVPGRKGRGVSRTASIGFCAYPFVTEQSMSVSKWAQLLKLVEKLLSVARRRGRARACGVICDRMRPASLSEERIVRRLLA